MEKQTKIYIIRHGSIDNPDDISYGRLPLPLSDKGIREVEDLAGIFKKRGVKFGEIYTSPVARARQSAAIIKGVLGVNGGLLIREELSDVDVGDLEGAPMQILRDANYSEENLREMGYEVESKVDIAKRMDELFEYVLLKSRGKNVAFVTHGDVSRIGLWSQEFPEKRPPKILRDEKYLAVAEAVVLSFEGMNYVGCELVRRNAENSMEVDHTRRTEAY